MADDHIEDAKAVLRDKARLARASVAADIRTDAGAIAANAFFNAVTLEPDWIVAGYWPIRDEFDCRPILVRLMDSGQPVCLPVTEGDQPLTMRLWGNGEALYPSGFGTLAPIETAPVVEPDIVLIPLLGFDSTGTRLGYGKGHYDRTIVRMKKKPQLIGLAFAAQEFPLLPREAHDIPLDAIITEAGIRHFGAGQ